MNRMPDREKVIKDLEECLSASCRGFRPRVSCPYNDDEWDIMRDALELLKEQQGISIDEFLKWCIESHMMGDATRKGIEYWVNEFKAWKQKAKDGEHD